MGLHTIQVDVVRIAVAGDIVFAERVDRLRRRDGTEIAAAAVTGVFEFSGDTIAYWREYFDAGTFVVSATRRGLGLLGSRLLRLASPERERALTR
jgi:limonene-1,2-epoxide hydrolase